MADNFTRTLPGMYDWFDSELERLDRVKKQIQKTLTTHAYRWIDTPVLERTELFLRKFGGEVASQLYTFHEPGGHKVSLRPEFTSSVIRMFVSTGLKEELPVRLQYAGPVFRYELDDSVTFHQITQVGAELIGESSPHSDAEVISMACQAVANQSSWADSNKIRLILGHVGVINTLLQQFKLPERGIDFFLANMGQLRNGLNGKNVVRLAGQQSGLFRTSVDHLKIVNNPETPFSNEVQSLASKIVNPGDESMLGARTFDEIMSRFSKKYADNDVDISIRLERALDFATELSQLRGAPLETVKAAKLLAKNFELDVSCLKEIEDIVEIIELHNLDSVEVCFDFGLSMGLAYYTGIVFEILPARNDSFLPVARGGRYDGLVKALGGKEHIPALGFAFNLERLADSMKKNHLEIKEIGEGTRVLVIPQDGRAFGQCLKLAQRLRSEGNITEISSNMIDDISVKKIAAKKGIQTLFWVKADGTNKQTTIK